MTLDIRDGDLNYFYQLLLPLVKRQSKPHLPLCSVIKKMDIFEVVKQFDEETLNVFFSAIKESEENRYVVNSKNSDKYTPLHVAIFARLKKIFCFSSFSSCLNILFFIRNWKAVELLIENDADINAKCYGTPPAILALQAATVADGKEFGLNVFQRIIQHPHVNPFAKVKGLTVYSPLLQPPNTPHYSLLG